MGGYLDFMVGLWLGWGRCVISTISETLALTRIGIVFSDVAYSCLGGGLCCLILIGG